MKQSIFYLLLLLLVSACEDTPQGLNNNYESQSDSVSNDTSNVINRQQPSDSIVENVHNQKDSLSNKGGSLCDPTSLVTECTPLKVLVVTDSTKTDSVNAIWVGYGNGEIKVCNGCEQDSICIMTLADSCQIVLKAQQDTVVACCEKGIVLKCHQTEIFLPFSFEDEMVVQPSESDSYLVVAIVELGLILLLAAIILVPIVLKKKKKKILCPRPKKITKKMVNEVIQQLSVEKLLEKENLTE